MKILIQRVSSAEVSVSDEIIGKIEDGIVAFIAIEPEDDEAIVKKMIDRLLNYRVFSDPQGRMNHSLLDIKGELLLISQFTLAADTSRGRRASFTTAAPPKLAEKLYNLAIDYAKESSLTIATGRFGADMKVSLTNDGPVTFLLES